MAASNLAGPPAAAGAMRRRSASTSCSSSRRYQPTSASSSSAGCGSPESRRQRRVGFRWSRGVPRARRRPPPRALPHRGVRGLLARFHDACDRLQLAVVAATAEQHALVAEHDGRDADERPRVVPDAGAQVGGSAWHHPTVSRSVAWSWRLVRYAGPSCGMRDVRASMCPCVRASVFTRRPGIAWAVVGGHPRHSGVRPAAAAGSDCRAREVDGGQSRRGGRG